MDTKVRLLKVVDRQGNFFQFNYDSGFGKKNIWKIISFSRWNPENTCGGRALGRNQKSIDSGPKLLGFEF